MLVGLGRPARISLIGLIELKKHLSDVLSVNVDVTVKKILRKRICERMLSEVAQSYGMA